MNTDENKEIGVVISDEKTPNPLKFRFQLNGNLEVSTGLYITAKNGRKTFFGQVNSAHTFNPYYADPRSVGFQMGREIDVDTLFPTESGEWSVGEANILGEWNGEKLENTGEHPKPGWEVELAPARVIERVFNLDQNGILLGKLKDNELNINLSPEDFFQHGLVTGQTGSGKTYAAGVIIEDCLEEEIPIVAVDPHGELGLLSEENRDQEENLDDFGVSPQSYNVTEYAPPEFCEPKQEEFTVRIGELSFSDLLSLVNLPGDLQEQLTMTAFRNMRGRNGTDFNYSDFLKEIERLGSSNKGFSGSTVETTKLRLSRLQELEILGQGLDPNNLVEPGKISLITLPGVDEQTKEIIVTIFARKLLRARMYRQVPRFILYLEEAHLFAPSSGSSKAKDALINFVKSGRKFGAGLIASTQQQHDISDKIVSQCQTRIFLRMDSKRDLRNVKNHAGVRSDELVDMLPSFPSGRCILKLKGQSHPLVVDVRPRKSKHGGITGEVRKPPKPNRVLKGETSIDDYSANRKTK